MTDLPDTRRGLPRYTRTAVVLHWLVAALMVVNVALGLASEQVPDDWIRPIINTHKSIGITVLGLALLRLLWRYAHPPPPMPPAYAPWERISAHVAHALLYVLMLALPLTGWLHDSAWKNAAKVPMTLFGLVPWPRFGFVMAMEPVAKERLHELSGIVHASFGYALILLFVLHVAGALKHQWLDRQQELQRMSL